MMGFSGMVSSPRFLDILRRTRRCSVVVSMAKHEFLSLICADVCGLASNRLGLVLCSAKTLTERVALAGPPDDRVQAGPDRAADALQGRRLVAYEARRRRWQPRVLNKAVIVARRGYLIADCKNNTKDVTVTHALSAPSLVCVRAFLSSVAFTWSSVTAL